MYVFEGVLILNNNEANGTRNVRQLETLYSISNILATGGRQREILAEVLDTLDSELGMKRGTITLLTQDRTGIMIEVAQNFPEARSRKLRYRCKGYSIRGVCRN